MGSNAHLQYILRMGMLLGYTKAIFLMGEKKRRVQEWDDYMGSYFCDNTVLMYTKVKLFVNSVHI